MLRPEEMESRGWHRVRGRHDTGRQPDGLYVKRRTDGRLDDHFAEAELLRYQPMHIVGFKPMRRPFFGWRPTVDMWSSNGRALRTMALIHPDYCIEVRWDGSEI